MGKNGEEEEQPPKLSTLSEPSRPVRGPPRPSITLPPRTSMESLFSGGSLASAGFSPGPMTLLSSFFADNDDCKSFSQLLAGAMGSPAAVPTNRGGLPPALDKSSSEISSNNGFKQSRPPGLSIASSPVFTIPPGLSPAGLLDSPGFFLPGQGPFGMTHQQVLAQITAHAAQANSHIHFQDQHSSLSSAPANSSSQLHDSTSNTTPQQMPPLVADSGGTVTEASNHDNSEHRQLSSSLIVDKPAADGYNWRKYGQKQVKGSEFPRSYYKCTHLNCPVKKKVERSLDGQVTEIIYKGQHNHEPPAPNKRGRDTGNVNEDSVLQDNFDVKGEIQSGSINRSREGMVPHSLALKEQESSQATAEHLSGTSDSEEVENDEKDAEPHPKRRNTEVRPSDPASSHRTITESRIIVQTTSEVDLLDDGYRWRKYGQKVVKGNPYPRSYYKCTSQGCNVRKHVERASTDPKAVITTYEGKHNHDVPAARYSSHNTGNNGASQVRLQNSGIEKQRFNNTDPENNDPQPIGLLRLKKEQTM